MSSWSCAGLGFLALKLIDSSTLFHPVVSYDSSCYGWWRILSVVHSADGVDAICCYDEYIVIEELPIEVVFSANNPFCLYVQSAEVTPVPYRESSSRRQPVVPQKGIARGDGEGCDEIRWLETPSNERNKPIKARHTCLPSRRTQNACQSIKGSFWHERLPDVSRKCMSH